MKKLTYFKLKSVFLILFVVFTCRIYSQDVAAPEGFKIIMPEQSSDNCITQSGYDTDIYTLSQNQFPQNNNNTDFFPLFIWPIQNQIDNRIVIVNYVDD